MIDKTKLSNAIEAAKEYLRNDLVPIPIDSGSKAPRTPGWQNTVASSVSPERDFSVPGNIGVLLGSPSNGVVDVDLDTQEAVAAARLLMPATLTFGRGSRPSSHLIFRSSTPTKTKRYQEPGGTTLVELRSDGTQTVFPPSTHPSGEKVSFEGPAVDPLEIEGDVLQDLTAKVAAATLLAKHWPKQGSRHDTALALAGTLLNAGWTEDSAAEFIRAVASVAGDEEVEDRVQCVASTTQRLAKGDSATGWTTLGNLFDPKMLTKVKTWLKLPASPRPKRTRGTIAPSPATAECVYFEEGGSTYWLKPTRQGPEQVKLANFTARILFEIQRSLNDETRTFFEMEATLCNGETRSFEVPATRFHRLEWVHSDLGSRAIVECTNNTRPRLVAAIQTLSKDTVDRRKVFSRLGWHSYEGRHVFVSGPNVIGQHGTLPGLEVSILPRLAGFDLICPASIAKQRAAILSSLEMGALNRGAVAALAAAYRAPLGPADFAVHLEGKTGVFKSETAALAQRHFGRTMDARSLPGSWGSTANSIRYLSAQTRDVLFCVDDFAPLGNQRHVEQSHRAADDVIRGLGNGADRARMNRDGTLQSQQSPACMLLSTGETTPRGQSLRARLLTVPLAAEDTDPKELTRCQDCAASGEYAESMAGYIQWLAPQLSEVRDWHAKTVTLLHGHVAAVHRRHSYSISELASALALLLNYALHFKAVERDQAEAHWSRWWRVLSELAEAQSEHSQDADPVERFRNLLNSALYSGNAHLVNRQGEPPTNPADCGWQKTRTSSKEDWVPRGDKIGWIDERGLYLDKLSAFSVAATMAKKVDHSLGISANTLSRRLDQADLLQKNSGKGLSVRRTLEKKHRSVLHLPPDWLRSNGADEPCPEAQKTTLPSLPLLPISTGGANK